MHAVVLILQEFLWLCLTAFTLSFKIFLNITSLYNEMMWLYTASLYLYHVACTQGCCACVVNGLSCCCYSLDRRAKPSNRKRSRAYVRPCRVAARNTMRRWSKTMLLQNLSDLEMRILLLACENTIWSPTSMCLTWKAEAAQDALTSMGSIRHAKAAPLQCILLTQACMHIFIE